MACHLVHQRAAAHMGTQGDEDGRVGRGRGGQGAVDLCGGREGVAARGVLADEEHLAQQGRYFDAVANTRPALAVGAADSHGRRPLVLLLMSAVISFFTFAADCSTVLMGVAGECLVRDAIQASTSDSRQATA